MAGLSSGNVETAETRTGPRRSDHQAQATHGSLPIGNPGCKRAGERGAKTWFCSLWGRYFLPHTAAGWGRLIRLAAGRGRQDLFAEKRRYSMTVRSFLLSSDGDPRLCKIHRGSLNVHVSRNLSGPTNYNQELSRLMKENISLERIFL